jgi:mono/diheme cytochrome c family protein
MPKTPISLWFSGLATALVAAALLLVPLATGATPPPTKAQIAAGKKVFLSAACGKCHVMKAVHASGTVGPNLDTHKYSLAAITRQVTSGGRFMPPFDKTKGGSLSSTQVKNVSAFVYASEHAKK